MKRTPQDRPTSPPTNNTATSASVSSNPANNTKNTPKTETPPTASRDSSPKTKKIKISSESELVMNRTTTTTTTTTAGVANKNGPGVGAGVSGRVGLGVAGNGIKNTPWKVNAYHGGAAAVASGTAMTVPPGFPIPVNLNNNASRNNVDGDSWTKVERRKQKKAMKKEIKIDQPSAPSPSPPVANVSRVQQNAQPRFMYSNSEIVKRNTAIGIEEIRELILHIVADAPPPNWLRIDNANLIQRAVALMIPGLTSELLSLPPLPTVATANPNIPISIPFAPKASADALSTTVPFIASTFSHACPTRAPGDQTRMHSALSAFFHGPVSTEEKKKRIAARLASEQGRERNYSQHVLSLEQMIENDYPIPSHMADVFEKPEGWVETPKPVMAQAGGVGHKIYAIDCEMCLTEDGKELTRVCIIDFHTSKVVYDKLVKPPKPVTDYLTRWSGITEAQLAPATTTLQEVQAELLRLLSPPAQQANPFAMSGSAPRPTPTPILLGHSLESDLKALKTCHSLCIDTAVIFHHPRGRPLKPGLAWLTRKWCGREIQTRGEGGHDPEEDARACKELLQKKMDGGPGFGEFKTDYESIFERAARSTRKGAGGTRSAVVDHGNPAVMHGSKANTAIPCQDDGEVVAGLLNVIESHHFAFGRFLGLAQALGWLTPKASPDGPPPVTPPSDPSPEALSQALDNLHDQLKTLHTSLPPKTAIIIFTGHSDPRKMAALNARKTAFESAVRAGKSEEEMAKEDLRWSMADSRELEEAVELAKRGLLFLGVKA